MAFDDDLDELREKSFRTSSAYSDDFDDDDFGTERRVGFLSRFTPFQRRVLAGLVLLDILVIGFVIFVITGVIPFG